MLADSLTDMEAKTIAEMGTVDVLDYRHSVEATDAGDRSQTGPSLAVQASVVHNASGATWRIALLDVVRNRMVWASAARQRGTGLLDIENPHVLRALNQLVDAAVTSFMAACNASDERPIAALLCHQGGHQMSIFSAISMASSTLGRAKFGTHSLRRAKAVLIYRRSLGER